jgi:hypothetical protein
LITVALGEQSESHKNRSLPKPFNLFDSILATAIFNRHFVALKLTDGGGVLPLDDSLCDDLEDLEE